jgi:chromosome segregation ATPase
MERLKRTLEDLDEEISTLEDKIGFEQNERLSSLKKQSDIMKQSRSREASVLAMAQKVASRLDQAIHHVEQILRD